MKTIIELNCTKTGWRWTMRDYRNRKIIAASTEGYRRRIDAVNNLQRVSGVWGQTPSEPFAKTDTEVREVVET